MKKGSVNLAKVTPAIGARSDVRTVELPPGLTLMEIVSIAIPGLPTAEYSRVRLDLSLEGRHADIPLAHWPTIKPKSGVAIHLTLVPQGDKLRDVLSVVVSIAAISLGQYWATKLIPTAGFGQSLLKAGIALGVNAAGALLINAIAPLPQRSRSGASNTKSTYSISGWQNVASPNEALPWFFGHLRVAPALAASSYSEIVNGEQYVRSLFCFGEGPLTISDMRLGETPLSSFDDVQVETREGRDDDAPLSLYPTQVIEQAEGVELLRNYPRLADGAPDETTAAIESPVERVTALDTAEVVIIFSFPNGLFSISSSGSEVVAEVSVRVRQRAQGTSVWQDVETLTFSRFRREGFFEALRWSPPSRGTWEVEVTRITPESTSTRVSDRVFLSSIQSHRPEYPLATGAPLALVALRVRATHQINGSIEVLNTLIQREGRILSDGGWSHGLTTNPASAFLSALQSTMNPFPVEDSEIDWPAMEEWYGFCQQKGLSFNHAMDQPETLRNLLIMICSAGRAAPRHDGTKWSVVIDRPDLPVVAHVGPRTHSELRWTREYIDPPHAFRVPFLDETADYRPAERIVPWPGHAGEVTLTETLAQSGKTNPAEVWIETRRRQHEIDLRASRYALSRDGLVHPETRGDKVLLNWELLDVTQQHLRVCGHVASGDRLIRLDTEVDFEEGVEYGIQYRLVAAETESVTTVQTTVDQAGPRVLKVGGNSAIPPIGAAVFLGRYAAESAPMRVVSIEAGNDFGSILQMVPDAPEIDTLTDAEVPPVWDGRVGEVLPSTALIPVAPRFERISTGSAAASNPEHVTITLALGQGAVSVASFLLQHRLVGASIWTDATVSAASRTITLEAYSADDVVELQALSRSSDGTLSTSAASATVTVGHDGVPAALSTVSAQAHLGAVEVSIQADHDPLRARVKLWRSTSNDFASAAPVGESFQVGEGETVVIVGQPQANLVINGEFVSASNWTVTSGWTIAGGSASHDGLGAADMSQTLLLQPQTNYAWSLVGSGSPGSETVDLTLAGDTDATISTSANGWTSGVMTSPDNSAEIKLSASDYEGWIDDIVVRAVSAETIAPGSAWFWVVPETASGAQGPASGPYQLDVR